MQRPVGYAALVLAVLATVGAVVLPELLPQLGLDGIRLGPATLAVVLERGLTVVAVVAAGYGVYAVLSAFVADHAGSKRRRQEIRTVLRLAVGVAVLVAVLGVLTAQWLGALVSLGVIGFAVTFALQQPLFSLIGWFYIQISQPYRVGDRVAIEGSRGDVIAVGVFVTTLQEIDGDLVATNQPSGRTITVPNSVVLSSHVANYTGDVPYIWNELPVQVSYETDLEFAVDVLVEEASDHLGEEMAAGVAEYREHLAETPVEVEVRDRPTVNVVQRDSWVELRLRYLVDPRRGTRARNELYRRILDRLADHPDRVSFPVGRNR